MDASSISDDEIFEAITEAKRIMGDRCWAKLTFKASDIEKFKIFNDIKDQHDMEADGDVIRIEWEEINYAGYDMMHSFSDAGLTCILEHGRGDNYGCGYIFVFGGYKFEIAITDDGEFFVPVDDEGVPDKNRIIYVKHAIRLKKLIQAYFEDRHVDYAAEMAKAKFYGDPFINRNTT